jgi:MFS family permease
MMPAPARRVSGARHDMTVSSRQADRTPTAYHRDAVTWRLFAGLAAFGFLNAVLGPALPYLRAIEHVSYVAGALHQVAFAIGGGLAGTMAARGRGEWPRARIIALGLAVAALGSIGVAYGAHAPITIASAFVMSLFGTAALIRMWAVLADIHGPQRTVALTEGEVLVSAGSIVTPLLVGAVAATALTWRGALVLGALAVGAIVAALRSADIPPPHSTVPDPHPRRAGPGARVHVRPTLVIVFAIVALEFSLSFWLATYLHDSIGIRRGLAVLMVSGLYAGNLGGRVLASRAARRLPDAVLLGTALFTALLGLPLLLGAQGAAVATIGIAVTGAGIGAMFPLTSSLHVASSAANADTSMGEVLAVAALGQIAGPLAAGIIAQAAGLRTGLLVLPALAVLGLVGLAAHRRRRG